MFVQFFDVDAREYWTVGVGRIRLGWYRGQPRSFSLWVTR